MIAQQREDAARTQARRLDLSRISPWALLASDALLLYLAVVTAYWIRYTAKLGGPVHNHVAFSAYQPLALLLLVIMIPVLLSKGAYRVRMSTELSDEIALVFSAATISVATIVVVAEMAHQNVNSRGVIVYLWVLVIAFLVAGRTLIHSIQAACRRRGVGIRKVVVVGVTDAGMMAMQRMQDRPDYGLQLEGFVYPKNAGAIRNFGRFRALGTVDTLPSLLQSGGVEQVILALPASAHEEAWSILELCERQGVALKIIPDLFEMSMSRVQVDDIAGIPLFEVRELPARHVGLAMKRVVDLVLGSLLFVLTLPVFAVMWILIRIETPGPSLLRQERVGAGRRRFTLYKFRTMRTDAEELQEALEHLNDAEGPLFKMRDDPRCTSLGRRIRRWSLDELPNLLNVIKGDMSLVGPRPPLPKEVEQYGDKQWRRLEAKPGMTGLWQVSGRSNLPFDEMLMMDIYYVENWSLGLDMKIMLRTVGAVLSRHGAY